jgi:serine/threonine protein kinase
MPAPATLDEFLLLVQRSGLVEDDRLDEFLRRLDATRTLPTDPAQLAERCVNAGLLTFFQVEQLLQGKWRGFSIGKYKVLERIGFGGMGQVYLCEHERMRRRVAVKVLPTTGQEPGALERFEREARAAAAVDHPNIVRAFDIDQDGKLHFLVMEYVDGPTLYDLVRQSGPMEITRACHYIRQAALGLHHAHEAGLVHRDIKPSNILVDRQGLVKVLDLGLARFRYDHLDSITKRYDDNHVLGTADYVAPEQTHDSHNVDGRADVYGLGCTFYFVLTGRPPFPEGTPTEKLLWHRNRRPEPVQSLRRDLPIGVAVIVEKMMAKQKEQRFQTPLEAAHALAPWTQEAVPPPAEAELPPLSPAALGAGLPPPPAKPPTPAPKLPKLPKVTKAPKVPKLLDLPKVPKAAHEPKKVAPAPSPFAAPAPVANSPFAKAIALSTAQSTGWRSVDWGMIKGALFVTLAVLIGCAAGLWINHQRQPGPGAPIKNTRTQSLVSP